MESMVVVDCWQNQRYRPMQGTWLKPFDGGVAFYTDITGNFGIPYSKNEVDSLMSVDLEYRLPPGWEWADDDWRVDMSSDYGESVDNDGWFYAASFETLFDQCVRKCMIGEMSRMSLVRRRRWTRRRICVTEAAGVAFRNILRVHDRKKRVLQEVLAWKQQDFNCLNSHYTERSIEKVPMIVNYADSGLREVQAVLKIIISKLTAAMQYLIRRGRIEKEYSEKLASLADFYAGAGQISMTHLGVGSDTELVPSSTPQKSLNGTKNGNGNSDGSSPGFFECMSDIDTMLSSQSSTLASMLTESLPLDVESVVAQVRQFSSTCESDGVTWRNQALQCEEAVQMLFTNYSDSTQWSRVNTAMQEANLASSVLEVSAAECDYSVVEKETRRQCHNNDTFVCGERYRLAVLAADNAIGQYSAFVMEQRKEVRVYGTRIQALLQATIKVVHHEQKRIWEDMHQEMTLVLDRYCNRTTAASNSDNGSSKKEGNKYNVEKDDDDGDGWMGNSPVTMGHDDTPGNPMEGWMSSPVKGTLPFSARHQEVSYLAHPVLPVCLASKMCRAQKYLSIAVYPDLSTWPPPLPSDSGSRSRSTSTASMFSPLNSPTPSSGKGGNSPGMTHSAGTADPSFEIDVKQYAMPAASEGDVFIWKKVSCVVTYDYSLLLYMSAHINDDSNNNDDDEKEKSESLHEDTALSVLHTAELEVDPLPLSVLNCDAIQLRNAKEGWVLVFRVESPGEASEFMNLIKGSEDLSEADEEIEDGSGDGKKERKIEETVEL